MDVELPYKQLEDEDVPSQPEEPWDTPQENLIGRWRDASDSLAAAHEGRAAVCKRKSVWYGLPGLMIPTLMAPLSTVLKDSEWIAYVETAAFMTTAAASAMVQFFDFSGKAEKHFAFAARYADLVTDIDQELAKPRRFRQQVDTFSLKIKMMYDALNRAAPDL